MRSLSRREALISMVAVSMVLPVLGWRFGLQPVLSERQSILAELQDLTHLRAALDRQPADVTSAPLAPLPQRVTTTARTAGLTIQRLDPSGTALTVTIADASFPALIRWLDRLTRDMGVRVLSADLVRRTAPGRIRAELVLEATK
jgi:type II secretory pathway component PulM